MIVFNYLYQPRSFSVKQKIKVIKCFFSDKRMNNFIILQRIEGEFSFDIQIMNIVNPDILHLFLDIMFDKFHISIYRLRQSILNGKQTEFTFFELLLLCITNYNSNSNLENLSLRFNQFQYKFILLHLFTMHFKENNYDEKLFEFFDNYNKKFNTQQNYILQADFLSYGFKYYHNILFNKLDLAIATLEKAYNLNNVNETNYNTIIHTYIKKNSTKLQRNCQVNFEFLLNCIFYDNNFNTKLQNNPILIKQVKRHLNEINLYFRVFTLYEKLLNNRINFERNYLVDTFYSLSVLISDKTLSAKDSGKIIKLLTLADQYYLNICVEILPDLIKTKLT